MSEPKGTPRFKLGLYDLKKWAILALVYGVGAVATFVLEKLPQIDFGEATPFIVLALGSVLNFVRKWATDTQAKA